MVEHAVATLNLERTLEIEACSPAFCEIFECTPADVIGRDIDALVEGSGLSMRLRTGETPDPPGATATAVNVSAAKKASRDARYESPKLWNIEGL